MTKNLVASLLVLLLCMPATGSGTEQASASVALTGQQVFTTTDSKLKLSDSDEESDFTDDVTPLAENIEPSRAKLKPVKFSEITDSEQLPVGLLDTTDTYDWNPLDTLSFFGGLEGSKQPQDFGVNANFGSRWAVNWGIPLLMDQGLGAQIGTSVNYTNDAVQVFERVGETSHRTQVYSTFGLFQRTNGWSWGVGYDLLFESYYSTFWLGQWRGRAGYAVTQQDEFGVWGTFRQQSDSGMFLNIPVTLSPINQGSFYWQHQFMAGTRVMGWAGVSEGHAQANLALGDLSKTGPQFVFGAEIDVPLNRYFAIYGQANFISPADSGTVDSYLGVAYYPGGHAFPATRNPFAPLLALANNTMFATNLSR